MTVSKERQTIIEKFGASEVIENLKAKGKKILPIVIGAASGFLAGLGFGKLVFAQPDEDDIELLLPEDAEVEIETEVTVE